MSYHWLNNPIMYETDNFLSQQMAKIINMGFGYPIQNVRDYNEASDAVMYGILRGCTEIMTATRNIGRNYVNIDHGYFTNRNNNPHYRLTRNARHYAFKLLDLPNDRFKQHSLTIQDYNLSGTDIMVLPPSIFWAQYSNIDHISWTENVNKLLKTFTDKNIIIKNKNDEKPLKEYLKNAYAVIHYSSMGAVDALLVGVPVITLGPSFLSNYSSTDISEINNLKLFDREKLFYNLAYNQFTIQEIANGYAKNILNEIYKQLDN